MSGLNRPIRASFNACFVPRAQGSVVWRRSLPHADLDAGFQNNRISWWVQLVERVYKKLISAKWLVTTVCEMRYEGSAQASRPITQIRLQAGGKTAKIEDLNASMESRMGWN